MINTNTHSTPATGMTISTPAGAPVGNAAPDGKMGGAGDFDTSQNMSASNLAFNAAEPSENKAMNGKPESAAGGPDQAEQKESKMKVIEALVQALLAALNMDKGKEAAGAGEGGQGQEAGGPAPQGQAGGEEPSLVQKILSLIASALGAEQGQGGQAGAAQAGGPGAGAQPQGPA